jgi:preprotein translocase subunit YajC
METYYSLTLKISGQRVLRKMATTDLKGLRVGDLVNLSDGFTGIVRRIQKTEGFSITIPRAETPVQRETKEMGRKEAK